MTAKNHPAVVARWHGELARRELEAFAALDVLWSDPAPTRQAWGFVLRTLEHVADARRALPRPSAATWLDLARSARALDAAKR